MSTGEATTTGPEITLANAERLGNPPLGCV
jgi:hypothetical protein